MLGLFASCFCSYRQLVGLLESACFSIGPPAFAVLLPVFYFICYLSFCPVIHVHRFAPGSLSPQMPQLQIAVADFQVNVSQVFSLVRLVLLL